MLRSLAMLLLLSLAAACGSPGGTVPKPQIKTGAESPTPTPTATVAPTPTATPSPTPTPTPEDKLKSFELTCDDTAEKREIELEAPIDVRLRFKGQICPRLTTKLQVLFLVDTSAAMNTADALTAATCMRLDAARAIVAKLKAAMKPGDSVDIGAIGFGSTAATEKTFTPLAQFEATLVPLTFCSGSRNGTNYKAAFDLATEQLATIRKGNTLVYLLSGTTPTEGGGVADPNDAGDFHKTAGRTAYTDRMKGAAENLTINLLFLKTAAVETDPGMVYYSTLSTDATRVKLVADPTKLTAKLDEFVAPKITLDEASARIERKADTFEAKKFTFSSIKRVDAKDVWAFETGDLATFSKEGEVVKNEIRFYANDTIGTVHETLFTIKFKIKPKVKP